MWQRSHDNVKKKCQIDAHNAKSVPTQPKKTIVNMDKPMDRLYRHGVEKERKGQSFPKDVKAGIESGDINALNGGNSFVTRVLKDC